MKDEYSHAHGIESPPREDDNWYHISCPSLSPLSGDSQLMQPLALDTDRIDGSSPSPLVLPFAIDVSNLLTSGTETKEPSPRAVNDGNASTRAAQSTNGGDEEDTVPLVQSWSW
eukprot:CAMPEP_0183736292 /NCGR_PEP_ID=MMETSP0737-20130205/48983_1 /TAXON_ID=385413 /ORGANISM="Thalassiosira miniscula, Strain CCMP1093" /LENGTH=113 /DNA_ID=CAMNT_0025970249 /DNA_START=326 /DNA_END=664 /DNA_ORIENTATION=-